MFITKKTAAVLPLLRVLVVSVLVHALVAKAKARRFQKRVASIQELMDRISRRTLYHRLRTFHAPVIGTPEGAESAISYMEHLKHVRRYAYIDQQLLNEAIDGLVQLHGLPRIPA